MKRKVNRKNRKNFDGIKLVGYNAYVFNITNIKNMNYGVLKGMLDSLIKTYKCEGCNCSTTEENVSIIGAAGKTVNINIECKKCKKNSMVKMEIVGIDLTKLNISKNKLNQINSKIRDLGLLKNKSLENIEEGEMILDEEIINLSRELKGKSFKVDDLFKN